MAKAGVRLPIHSYTLQAMVSEPVKPCLDIVLLHLGTGVYASQSDKGELVFGGGLDRIPSYGQRGAPPMQEIVISGLLDMFPAFGQLKLMRQWGGIVDVVPEFVADHRTGADAGHLSELRLGHRRLQGDSGRRHAARAS